jgi:hypothetical protein
MRSRVVSVLLTSAAVACSSSGAAPVGEPAAAPAIAEPTSDTSPVAAAVANDGTIDQRAREQSGTAASEGAGSVRLDVTVAGVSTELSGLETDSGDPFGDFVSCSGLRSVFGTYSVLVSDVDGAVRSVSVVSADLVPEPGVYDAAVRVEFADATAVDATGTITVDAGRRSGSFLAFDNAGSTVEGSFDCLSDAAAEPLTVADADGVLDVIEVFALLRSGDAERIVGLAGGVDDATSMACPGADDATGDSETVVRVEGDESIGAITSFELTGGPTARLRMRVGDQTYEFDRVDRGGSDLPSAGTFTAESGGVRVDGAFRCS